MIYLCVKGTYDINLINKHLYKNWDMLEEKERLPGIIWYYWKTSAQVRQEKVSSFIHRANVLMVIVHEWDADRSAYFETFLSVAACAAFLWLGDIRWCQRVNSGEQIEAKSIAPPDVYSDHSLISWCLPFVHQPPITLTREIRMWRKLYKDKFRASLRSSGLCDANNRPSTSAEYFQRYHTVLEEHADKFAPIKEFTQWRQHLAAWMDDKCIRLRRHSRMLEQRYRARKTPADYLAWVKHERHRHTVYHRKENQFWSLKLSEQASQPRKMWKTISTILGMTTSSDNAVTGLTEQSLMDFFNKKIESVRQSTGGTQVQSSLPAATMFLDTFQTYTPDEIGKIILSVPSKSCQLDPLPTYILKEFLQELLPYITEMCNGSLEVGGLPFSQRHAIVQPRLKKTTADPDDVTSYRPISNLTFMTKIMEKPCLPSNYWFPQEKWSATKIAVRIPTLPLNGDGSFWKSYRTYSAPLTVEMRHSFAFSICPPHLIRWTMTS